ncbi:VOC family protein [Glaciecola sp. 1036]|uniref:VOC family protein n=1 Tax=Alteromonadaceae TaxID=72275 RepID=UPI003CFF3A89
MQQHNSINYIELHASDLNAVKKFFSQTFAWQFTDYGEQYTAFSANGFDGGFFQSDKSAKTENGSPLVVIYSAELEQSCQDVKDNGGEICKEIFSFPGGRRFHFLDPCGNEWAVWGE